MAVAIETRGTEVEAKAKRCRFTAEYRRRILQEAAACAVAGEIGAAIGMGKKLIAVVPSGTRSEALPAEIRARRFLVRNEPTETATKVASAIAQASEVPARSA